MKLHSLMQYPFFKEEQKNLLDKGQERSRLDTLWKSPETVSHSNSSRLRGNGFCEGNRYVLGQKFRNFSAKIALHDDKKKSRIVQFHVGINTGTVTDPVQQNGQVGNSVEVK